MREPVTEFYEGDNLLSIVRGLLPVRKGESVCIRKVFYRVTKVAWAIDSIPSEQWGVCAVYLKRAK